MTIERTEPKKQTAIRLEGAMLLQIDRQADAEDRERSDMIRLLIKRGLEVSEGKK